MKTTQLLTVLFFRLFFVCVRPLLKSGPPKISREAGPLAGLFWGMSRSFTSSPYRVYEAGFELSYLIGLLTETSLNSQHTELNLNLIYEAAMHSSIPDSLKNDTPLMLLAKWYLQASLLTLIGLDVIQNNSIRTFIKSTFVGRQIARVIIAIFRAFLRDLN